MWVLINFDKRLAVGGSCSPGTNTMNQEEVESDAAHHWYFRTVHLLALWDSVNVSVSTTKVVLGKQKTMTQIYSVTIAMRHCFA